MGGRRLSVWEFSVLPDPFFWGLKLLERLLWERSKMFSLLVANNNSFFLQGKETTAKKLLAQFGGSDGKASAYNEGDLGSIPGLGRSPGEGNGNPLQCSCLENSMDRGAWWATVHGVAKSRTRLSDFTFTFKK